MTDTRRSRIAAGEARASARNEMPAESRTSVAYRLAVVREDLADGKEWSIYLLNAMPYPVNACLARVSFEWGDRGHSEAPMTVVEIPAAGAGLLWRESWEGAELNMELQIRIRAREHDLALHYELGKLYRRREPSPIPEVGTAGWLVLASNP